MCTSRWLRGLGLPARATELQLESLPEWRDGLRLCEVVEALERCITELSAIVSHTSTIWADHCESPGDKTQFQAPLACVKQRPGP